MIRQIIIPKERTYTLEIPQSFIGKKIELLAFLVGEEEKQPNRGSFAERTKDLRHSSDKTKELNRLNNSLEGYRVDLSDFSFDRDEANEYE